ncbi:MAG: hypothetical protein II800_00575 [Lachnospiraceae bacterium]|nr:hypothetical protein [Lachnospiraceae bacterium]
MISITEIILIVLGFAAVVLGYLLPAGKNAELDTEEIEELVQDKLDRSLNESVRRQIDGMAQDAVADAIDDNKLDLSRISNEKVMEISEYAGTVLDDIKKNHDEVVFMYDMLNDKHKNLTHAVTEMTRTAETAKQTVRDAELTARDAKDAIATLDAATARAKVAAQTARVSDRLVPPEMPEQQAEEQPAAPARSAEEDAPRRVRGMQVYSPMSQAEDDSGFSPMTVEQVSEEPEPAIPVNEVDVEEPIRLNHTPSTAKTAPKRSVGEPMSQNRQILEMHNAGKSNMVIARELGLGIGEVRLVIDLSRKQGRT